jgi:hypothetical protein
MMSAAILIATATGQTSVHPVSPDQVEREETSFAKSLDERVGHPPLLQGKISAEEMTPSLRSSKSTEVAGKPDEIAEGPSEVEKTTVAGHAIPAGNELKSTVATKIVEPQTVAIAGAKGKMTVSNSEKSQAKPPVQEEDVADGISTSSVATELTSTASLTLDSPMPRISVADERPPVSDGDEVTVSQGREPAEKVVDRALLKTSPKIQENTATTKIAPKAPGATVNTPVIEATPAMVPAETSLPLDGQSVGASVVALPNEISKTTGVVNQTVSGARSVVARVTPNEPTRKEDAAAAKPATMGAETPLPAPVIEKSAQAAIPGDNNDAGKMQNLSAPAAAMVHAVSAGGLSVGIVPGATPSGDLSVNGTAAKLPVVDATLHPAELQLEQRELHGLGGMTTAMNEMPRMLTAIPTALEVGIPSGTYGWLKVRAEMVDGGAVNASVSAVSSAGQEMLHRELPALTSYLQEEKVLVNALVVHSTAGAELRGPTTGMDSGGGPTQQRNNEGGEQRQYDGSTLSDGSDEAVSYQGVNLVGEEGLAAPAMYERGGNWLSVRA